MPAVSPSITFPVCPAFCWSSLTINTRFQSSSFLQEMFTWRLSSVGLVIVCVLTCLSLCTMWCLFRFAVLGSCSTCRPDDRCDSVSLMSAWPLLTSELERVLGSHGVRLMASDGCAVWTALAMECIPLVMSDVRAAHCVRVVWTLPFGLEYSLLHTYVLLFCPHTTLSFVKRPELVYRAGPYACL